MRRHPVDYDPFLPGRALTRVWGTAYARGTKVAWSFIEKTTGGPSIVSAYLYDNGMREFAAYRSGLLDDLAPDVHSPDLLAAEMGADGGFTLWLEDLNAVAHPVGTPDEVAVAARHLGRLAGRWVDRVPDHRWLFRDWIARHSQRHALGDGLRAVDSARRDPAIVAGLAGRLDEAARLMLAQDEFASALRRLPQTLCHHDAVAANVFARHDGMVPATVLIDWESVGPGPVGADLASLLFASPRRGDFASSSLPELMPRALAAYREGLHDVDAAVTSADVALGMHAAISLRWTLVRDVVRVLDGTNVARRGSAPQESAEQALSELAALVPVLLDSAAEARRMMAGGNR